MNKLKKIFKKQKDIVIGAIHFPPLLGYEKFPGFDMAFKSALKDLKAFEDGGADGVIFENNYDIPHKEFVNPSSAVSMVFLGEKIRKATKLPVGINVLWNDFYTALSIAKVLNLQFIRVPVFVDKVKTDCGVISGRAKEITAYRKKIGAENIALFTDIHVKHSKLLSKNSLLASARLAMKNHSDAIIVTGKWTGQAPDLNGLRKLKRSIKSFPVLVGSGLNKENIRDLFKYASGAIVSTSLKSGSSKKGETNIKSYGQRISLKKVKDLIKA